MDLDPSMGLPKEAAVAAETTFAPSGTDWDRERVLLLLPLSLPKPHVFCCLDFPASPTLSALPHVSRVHLAPCLCQPLGSVCFGPGGGDQGGMLCNNQGQKLAHWFSDPAVTWTHVQGVQVPL